MRPLVWFRSDLRVRDNTALHEACQAAGDGVVAVFTICPDQWREHDWAPVRVDFLLRNLRDLSESLGQLQIPLLIVKTPQFAEVPGRLLQVAEQHGCGGVWFNREYEINEQRRDERVAELFERAGKAVHGFTDQVILPPERVRTTQGKFYTVFTPYQRSWIAAVKAARESSGLRCLPRSRKQKPIPARAGTVPESVAGFEGLRRPDLWPSGEQAAGRRLESFIAGRLKAYAKARDFPAVHGTSTLSPYLALGVLSPRQCLHAVLEANGNRLDSGSQGASTWISELVWREFYRHVLVGFPRVGKNEPFDLRTRQIRWRDDEAGFRRWQEGRTGVPIVDAGMRQLAQTGWMHNRLRMIVAMFLTKNLLIDWRRGEKHFLRNLVDGDFANNNGGWQWSASVGTDAAPYFRIFNPVSQSERFDPKGEFIRMFVPELAEVEGKAIHLPRDRAVGAAKWLDYPEPIVDLKVSRQRAIEEFRRVLER